MITPATVMYNELELNCWLLALNCVRVAPSLSRFNIQSSESVGALRKEIQKERKDHSPVNSIILWEVSSNCIILMLRSESEDCAHDVNILENEKCKPDEEYLALAVHGDSIPGAQMLNPLHRLWRVFKDAPEDEQIHILVQHDHNAGESECLSASTGANLMTSSRQRESAQVRTPHPVCC